MSKLIRVFAAVILGLFVAVTVPLAASAEVNELRISKQPGLAYLPLVIVEANKLVEKQAKQRGLGDVKVDWLTFNSGGAGVDALLSGSVDLVTSGSTNLLLIWSKTNGEVKGVSGSAALPMFLVTRDPKVKTLADFTSADKIAVPTVKVSTQAIVLQMAADKAFGEAGRHKLDQFTVGLGHPDAYIALQSPQNDVNSHFSLPPYQYLELKIPGVHTVVNSVDVVGGPATNGVTFGTTKFHDANPKLIAAFQAAMEDAIALVNKDKKQAAQIYLKMTGEKIPLNDLVVMLNQPNFVYSQAPMNTLKIAEFMFKLGNLKAKPGSWKEYFFPELHNLTGS